MIPYLTPDQFTYAFADLRGYGSSRHLSGNYTLEEAAGDTIGLADRLGWETFSLIGHSMSGLVVQRIPQLIEERISRVVAITPVPPVGIGLDQATVEMFQAIALGERPGKTVRRRPHVGRSIINLLDQLQITAMARDRGASRRSQVRGDVGPRKHFRSARGIKTPVLIIAAERDAPPFQADALNTSTLPFYPNGRLVSLSECGHYPMQELPPQLATLIERFLSE